MKILWLSNRIIDENPDKSTGTWLKSLAVDLMKENNINLANISEGKISSLKRADYGELSQWIVPYQSRKISGLPSKERIIEIKKVVDNLKPDIIQIWGTENYWGLLTARGILQYKTLLNIQGVISTITPMYYGGLSNIELLRCHGLKEFIRPSASILFGKYRFKQKQYYEYEIISNHNYIVSQSQWSRANVLAINPTAITFNTERALRNEFINSQSWLKYHNTHLNRYILHTTASMVPYKGLHTLLRAMSILKKKFPNLILNIAGSTKAGIRRGGYERFVKRLANELDISDNIQFLGPLDASMIVKSLKNSNVFIQPSFIESYSLSLAEAMYVGTPCVVSFAGAMPELAKDNESALFFTPGDHVGCASKIERLLLDVELSKKISINSREIAIQRHNPKSIVENQIEIYEEIIS